MKSLVKKIIKNITNKFVNNEPSNLVYPHLSIDQLKDYQNKVKCNVLLSKGARRKELYNELIIIDKELSIRLSESTKS